MTAPITHGDIVPLWMQPAVGDPDVCYGATDYRTLISSIFTTPGVITLADWAVTATGSSILNIGTGTAVVAGNTATEQHSYLCRNAMVKTIQPPGPPSAANRYDLIYLTAHDGQVLLDHLYEWQVGCLSGAESASPVIPTLPKDSIALAAALRKPAAANIAIADLTDLRKIALLPTQPQNQKYWQSVSSANSPAFTTTEVRDSSMPSLYFVVTDANAIYRITALSNIQSGRANNLCNMYIRDGRGPTPTTASSVIAGAQVNSAVAGGPGTHTAIAMRELKLALGAHSLGMFGRITSGASASSYLTVPSGGQKFISAEIVG